MYFCFNIYSDRYFDYLFYVDFEASMAQQNAQNALGHLMVIWLRILEGIDRIPEVDNFVLLFVTGVCYIFESAGKLSNGYEADMKMFSYQSNKNYSWMNLLIMLSRTSYIHESASGI